MSCLYYMHFNVFLGWIFQLNRLVPNEAEYMISILVNELARFSQRKIPLIRQKLWLQFVNVLCWFPSVRDCASIAEKTTQGGEFYWTKEKISIYNIKVDLKRVRWKSKTPVFALVILAKLQCGPSLHFWLARQPGLFWTNNNFFVLNILIPLKRKMTCDEFVFEKQLPLVCALLSPPMPLSFCLGIVLRNLLTQLDSIHFNWLIPTFLPSLWI